MLLAIAFVLHNFNKLLEFDPVRRDFLPLTYSSLRILQMSISSNALTLTVIEDYNLSVAIAHTKLLH